MNDWPDVFFEQMIRRSVILNYLLGSILDDEDQDG
jgi:hypothetical protein